MGERHSDQSPKNERASAHGSAPAYSTPGTIRLLPFLLSSLPSTSFDSPWPFQLDLTFDSPFSLDSALHPATDPESRIELSISGLREKDVCFFQEIFGVLLGCYLGAN